ncbi:hypothetical protein ACFX11_030830 [Malus domestica]
MRGKSYNPLIFRILMRINVRVRFVILLITLGVAFTLEQVSLHMAKCVLAKDEGPLEIGQISDAIRDGAEGFFRTQPTPQQEAFGLGRFTSAYITVVAFLLGALCSGAAGAARRSAREALQIAVRAGGFSALVVVGMAVLGIAILYATFYVWLGVDLLGSMKVTDLPLLLVGYGFGASFVALFAQLGGGIYTKAADVGADLVGKVEQGIPEDDPRNPAVIADLRGNEEKVMGPMFPRLHVNDADKRGPKAGIRWPFMSS